MMKEPSLIDTTRRKSRRLSATGIVAMAMLAALFTRTFMFDLVIVRGESMMPTIESGSIALVARFAYGIRAPSIGLYIVRWAKPVPGDIVLVDGAAGASRRAVKRIFEVGPAYLKAEAGVLTGSGGSIPVAETDALRLAGSSFVQRDRVFIIGDNAAVSFDSRNYGSVPIEKVAGKVILYRSGRSRALSIPESSKDTADDVDR
jgi:signal peptidase I